VASHGIPVTLVERHTGSSLHPRAIGYTTRTLELFRGAGIRLPPSAQGDMPPRRARVESIDGRWYEEYREKPLLRRLGQSRRPSPEGRMLCSKVKTLSGSYFALIVRSLPTFVPQ
jgi:hypothetical protein